MYPFYKQIVEIFWPKVFAYAFLSESTAAFAVGGEATISICESEKRWRLLASQTRVILLAPLLLFLSSYLISVLLWLGGFVQEKNEETAVMAIFSFYKLLHHEGYWKPFMLHLPVPLFRPLICLKQLLRERARERGGKSGHGRWWTLAASTSVWHLNVKQLCVCVWVKGSVSHEHSIKHKAYVPV